MLKRTSLMLLVVGLLAGLAAPAAAQGKKEYRVTTDRAFAVTKDVLVRQGFEVVRIENRGGDRIVWYRRGNMGQGQGKGPLQKLVIRRIENRIVFVDAPDVILVDIDVKLRLP